MQNKFIRDIFFIISFLAMPSLATEATFISLENGKVVKLNSDFTWEYVGDNTIIADKLLPSGTSITQTNNTKRNDINISLINSQWDNERLGLTFELASKSPDNYVMIELAINLYADMGELIKKETINVWQATFRLPETYLRNGQVRKSRTFWLEGIEKQKWTKKLMNIEIIKMESRG